MIPIEVSEREHLIFVTLSGQPSPESIIGMLRHLDQLIASDPSLLVLIDESELRAAFAETTDIAHFATAWQESTALRSTRIAVFTSNRAVYGLNRMFHGLADADGSMNVFSDRAAALAWLRDDPAH
ncbi:MAG: hypothetical protein QOH08_1154 [Chloroflexota bacterium]|nr:hypothetical protein [Chloroflexota bacterium]